MTEPAGRRTAVPKAAEVAVAALRRRIILGRLGEGDVLPSEDDLMAELGVSKPTLRQAIRILESESLVTVRSGGGSRGPVRSDVGADAHPEPARSATGCRHG